MDDEEVEEETEDGGGEREGVAEMFQGFLAREGAVFAVFHPGVVVRVEIGGGGGRGGGGRGVEAVEGLVVVV